MADQNRRADDPQDAPTKKGKAWLIPLLVAVVAASAGAAAVTQNDTLRQTVGLSVAAPDTSSTAPVEAHDYGVFMDMDGIVVNPKGTDGRRYFMVRIGVEAESQKTLDRLGDLGPAATDAVIGLAAELTVDELADITRRDSLKDAILDRFNHILDDDGPVSRIYFTQYVLQ